MAAVALPGGGRPHRRGELAVNALPVAELLGMFAVLVGIIWHDERAERAERQGQERP